MSQVGKGPAGASDRGANRSRRSKRRWLLTSLTGLLLAALVACAVLPGSIKSLHPRGPIGRFRAATFNIKWGNPRLDEIAAEIKAAHADIVCLQESTDQAEPILRKQLAGEYPHMVFRHAPSGGGFALLSRLPLKDVRAIVRPNGNYLAVLCRLDLTSRTVELANVHLHYFTPLLDTESLREKEIAQVHGKLSSGTPGVVLGDFNSDPSGKACRYLKARGFADSFASVTPDADRHATWQWKRGPLRVARRIDYIFHTADFKTVDSRVTQSTSSDHNLVVSTLEWAGRSSPPSGPTAGRNP